MLKLADFDYPLPKELIAQHPLENREEARLFVLERSSGRITHTVFKEIGSFLKENDLLVLNDTRVLHCRLIGKKLTGGKVEILLTRRLNGTTFSCLVQPSRTKPGEKIIFGGGKIAGVLSSRGQISFKQQEADVIYDYGVVPLPPYIRREPVESDKLDYQTVYASNDGALASPTAGLHFTEKMLADLPAKGIQLAYVTLHVGLGTFRPVRCEDITKHEMEPEYFQVPDEAVEKIKQVKSKKGRIIAVGTTSLRTLETYADGRREGNTNLFIYPGYKFKLADCLLTNFHLPVTTLFMLVCAFCAAGASASGGGAELMKRAYQEAVE